jgi:hypothetical protein
MKIGFTGTKTGMTDAQRETVRKYLVYFRRKNWDDQFHHGDCVGADEQAAEIAHELGYWVGGHPPGNEKYRAHFQSDHNFPAKDYLPRDHDIVDATDLLLAAPKTAHEIQRSGTWATVRYARKRGKQILIILPDGDIWDG